MNFKASAYLTLDPKIKKGEPRTIKLAVSFQRITKTYTVGGKNRYVADDYSQLNRRLNSYKEEIDGIEEKLRIAKQIAKELDKDFSFKSFKTKYHERAFGKKLNPKPEKRTTDLAKLFKIFEDESPISQKTKDQYYIGFSWIFKKCGTDKNVSIEKLNVYFFNSLSDFIKKEDRKTKIAAYKKKHGVAPESVRVIEDVSISSYYRGINAVCKYLAGEGYIDRWDSPFGNQKAKIKIVNKVSSGKGIKDEDLQLFANYSPSGSDVRLKEFAWCFYMFCFQCGGMNPIDIYGLKNSNLNSDEIHFLRRKTNRTTSNITPTEIQIPSLAKMILLKFGKPDQSNPNDYIFPFFESSYTEKQIRNKTDSINGDINDGIKLICDELGIRRYTLGGARHSQATYLADAMGDEKLVEAIAKRMAHNNPTITQTHYIELTKNKKKRIKAILDELVANNPYFNAENFFSK